MVKCPTRVKNENLRLIDMLVVQSTLLLFLPIASLMALMGLIWSLVKKRRRLFFKTCVFFMVSLILQIVFRQTEFWQVDHCLDKGGSYNYPLARCEHMPG